MLASILVILTPDPSDHLDLFDPRSEWSAVDGSGRVTSWGKSWEMVGEREEMVGDRSTHKSSPLVSFHQFLFVRQISNRVSCIKLFSIRSS